MVEDLNYPFFYAFPLKESNRMYQCLIEKERQEKTFKYKIYEVKNKINGKIYIGQTTKADNINYFGSGINIKKAVKKYGEENFTKRIILRAETKQETDYIEKYFIKFFRDSGWTLYNIADGGQGGNLGEEVNKKISKNVKGKNKGKKRSKEVKLNMSRSQMGRKHPEKVKLQMSLSAILSHNLLEYKNKQSQIQKIVQNKPEIVKKRSASLKKFWGNPKNKEMMIQHHSHSSLSEETKKKKSISMKAYYENGGINPRKGIPLSEEQKLKISLTRKEKFKKLNELKKLQDK